jgi:regulator of nucleoside diphosphate kinase
MPIRRTDKPPARPRIVIPASEHARLLQIAEQAFERDVPVAGYLVEELSRAHLVPDEACAPHVVRMGSQVTYSDAATNRTHTVTLVYPREADIDSNRISILTPIGAALIGMSPAQSIDWPTPAGGVAELTVLSVEQVEHAGR